MSNVLIGDICYVFDGPHATPTKTPEGPIYLGIDAITENGRLNPNEYNHLSEEDYKKWTKRVIPQKDDIVFSYEATLGRYAMIPEDFYGCLGRRLAIVRAKDNRVNPRWLYYYFLSPEWKVFIANHTVRGSTVDRISVEDFPGYPVPLPMREVQDNVVNVLSKIDARIDTNIRICIELENVAKTLYDYWFTQFDFPNAEGKPYRSSGGAMEWNDQLKSEIPKGWNVGNLYSIADPINGLACQKYRPKEDEAALPVVKIKEMHEGITEETESVSINIPDKHKIFDGDILFSWSATLEVMYWFGGDAGLNQHIFKVVPTNGYSREFVYHQFSAYVINFVRMAEARKTTMGHITTDHLEQSRIVLPPAEVVQAFSEIAVPIHEKIGHCRKENRELTKLRDWLLPMLMNGQATVAPAPSENETSIPSEPEVVEVLQAARSFSGTQSTFDDTADLVRYYKEHK